MKDKNCVKFVYNIKVLGSYKINARTNFITKRELISNKTFALKNFNKKNFQQRKFHEKNVV